MDDPTQPFDVPPGAPNELGQLSNPPNSPNPPNRTEQPQPVAHWGAAPPAMPPLGPPYVAPSALPPPTSPSSPPDEWPSTPAFLPPGGWEPPLPGAGVPRRQRDPRRGALL